MDYAAIVSGAFAVGSSILSGVSASSKAKAQKDAAWYAKIATDQFAEEYRGKLNELTESQLQKIYNQGDVFDRMNTAAFGQDNNIFNNVRKAQSDYSKLAAGDFSGFESQLRAALSQNLTSSYGSPIGQYTNLSAATVSNLRQSGISTTTGIASFLNTQANSLLSSEFGIMDKQYNQDLQFGQMQLQAKINVLNANAANTGVKTQAWANTFAAISDAAASMSPTMGGSSPFGGGGNSSDPNPRNYTYAPPATNINPTGISQRPSFDVYGNQVGSYQVGGGYMTTQAGSTYTPYMSSPASGLPAYMEPPLPSYGYGYEDVPGEGVLPIKPASIDTARPFSSQ